jgi:hypothetical protein
MLFPSMPMADPIPNEALRHADVPRRDAAWSEVVRFAQTFSAYAQMGAVSPCEVVAEHRRDCKTLSDLRACLWLEYRRHNHLGYPPDAEKMQYIYELLERIREHSLAE